MHSGHNQTISAISVTRDEKVIHTISLDGTVKAFSVTGPWNGVSLYTLAGHTSAVLTIVEAATGTFWTGSADHTLMEWTVPPNGDTGGEQRVLSCRRTLRGHTGAVSGVVIDSHNLFTASHDKTLIRWSVVRGQTKIVYTGHTGKCTSLCVIKTKKGSKALSSNVTTNRTSLISGSEDRTARSR
jgi:WD40 repeat protein